MKVVACHGRLGGSDRISERSVTMLFLFLGAVFVFTLAVALVGGVSQS